MPIETRIERDLKRRTLTALSVYVLDEKNRELHIRTAKHGPELVTTARVVTVDGAFVTFEVYGDFSKNLVRTLDRCTEKNVRAQHERVLARLDDLVRKVQAFYAAKNARS
ncbi:hypothetical protein D8I35_03625 [Corticibacter populi]|uniref:Uncharacterized protein n=1 Tax=Corticibacter populi TaxID=1550736 RepID=A0A3M6QZ77_9BURK|nr:hypothetical protein [Corticibacter populi]RMX08213.1 hypothetical protein D8I35_03625 [Corticibacter populi]RZS35481.1 hypothetical protein EV687_0549 [Corticibacter populi]